MAEETVPETVLEESAESLAEHLLTKGMKGSRFVREFLTGLPQQVRSTGAVGANLAGQVAGALTAGFISKLTKLDPSTRRMLKLVLPRVFIGAGEAVGNVLTDEEWKQKVGAAVDETVPEVEEKKLEGWFEKIGDPARDYAIALASTIGLEGSDFINEIASVPPNVFTKACEGLGDIQADGKLLDADRDKLLAAIRTFGEPEVGLWTRIKEAFGGIAEWWRNRRPMSLASKITFGVLIVLGLAYLVFLGIAVYKFVYYEIFHPVYVDAALWGVIWAIIIIALLWPVRLFEDAIDNIVDSFREEPLARGWSHNSFREMSGGLLIFAAMMEGGFLLAAGLLTEFTHANLESEIRVGRVAVAFMGILVSGANIYALAYGLYDRVKKNADRTVRTSYKVGRLVVFGLIGLVVLGVVGLVIKTYLWSGIQGNISQQLSLAEAAGGKAMMWVIILGMVIFAGCIAGMIMNWRGAPDEHGVRRPDPNRNRFLGGAIAVVAAFALGGLIYGISQLKTPDASVAVPTPPPTPPSGGAVAATPGKSGTWQKVKKNLCDDPTYPSEYKKDLGCK